MKSFVTLAMLGYASAQLQFCKSSDECTDPVYEGGCCHVWEIVMESDTPNYGNFEDVVFAGNMKKGEAASACFTKSHVEAREAEVDAQGYLNNVDDLRIFLEQNPGAEGALGLQAGATAEDWITAWGSDLDTHYKMIIKVDCVEDLTRMERRKFDLLGGNMVAASAMTLAAIVAANM